MLLLLLACDAPPAENESSPPGTTTATSPTNTSALCADGVPAVPFDPTAAGEAYGERAGDVTINTDEGPWSLAGSWTGCDTYLFVGVDPDDGYTSLLLDDELTKLLKKSPENAQYVLFADAAGNAATELQATLRAKVDDALDALGDDQAAWWSTRVHVATDTVRTAPGSIGALFAAYRFPLLGIDRSQVLREVGYIADPLTGWTTADWRTLAYEHDLYGFEAVRQARLDAQDATVVRVFDAADTRAAEWTGAATVDLPDAATMASFNRVEVDVTLECGGPWYESCPAWDTSDYVLRCATDDPATDDDESLSCEEMARIITGYWRGGRWVMDARHQLPGLMDGGPHTFRFSGSMANIVTVDLRFYREEGAPTPLGGAQLWWETADLWDAGYDARHARSDFSPPADATFAALVTIVTGHGSDSRGCGEFCPSEQVFTVNDGDAYSVSFPTAGTSDGCAERVATDGALPNQSGTWTYGRNGWCPGLGVAPQVWDITADTLFGADNSLGYQALLSGEPYVTDTDGNLDVGVWVIWGR